MKTTVIYHSADFDGIFCREIARKFLPPDTEFIGWNYGDPLIPFPDEGKVYILDLSPECLDRSENLAKGNEQKSRVIWIDHHKTAIDKFDPSIAGYRIDGVAACRLAWQWFATYNNGRNPFADSSMLLPDKNSFIQRAVLEPLAVRLAGEHDIWDKRDSRAELMQYGLRCFTLTPPAWENLLQHDDDFLKEVLKAGDVAQFYAQQIDASICNSRTWIMEWEGLRFLCLNSARFNSLSFAAKDVPETGHDALLGFGFNGTLWTFSLYHAKHRTDLDLSAIAKKYNGGGHRGACGFTCKTLPFTL